MTKTNILQVRMNKSLIHLIDSAVKSGMYQSRSDVLRDAVRSLFAPQLKDEVVKELMESERQIDKGEYVTLEELEKKYL